MLSIVSPFENTGHKTKLWMLLYMCVFLLQFMSEKPALLSVWIRDYVPSGCKSYVCSFLGILPLSWYSFEA